MSWFALALLLAAWPRAAEAGEVRTWTDSTGKFKMDAEFVEVANGAVRLKRGDGRMMNLPLAKLSDADRAYVKEQQQLRAGGGDPDNPFEAGIESTPGGSAPSSGLNGGRSGRPGRGRGSSSSFQEGDRVEVRERATWQPGVVVGFDPEWGRVFVKLESDGRMVQANDNPNSLRAFDPSMASLSGGVGAPLAPVDFRSIRRIVSLGGSEGTFAPDPAPSGPPEWTPRPLGLNPRTGFFEKLVGMSFAPRAARAMVAHRGGAGIHDDQSRVEICDLKSGRVTAMLPGPRNLKLAALSPSGTRLATISEVETFTDGPLQVWEIGDSELKPLKSWNVIAGEHQRRLEWLGWADDEHIMTVDHNGLTMWSAEKPAGVYHIPGRVREAPALSPGGKQLALGTDKGFSLHDVASGELLTRIPMENPGFATRVAFSPSGKLLAATGSSIVAVYDAATGKKLTEVYAAAADGMNRGLCFVDEEHVLVGGSDLIHLPSQVTVWKYEHNAESTQPLAGRVWYIFGSHGDDTVSLLPFKIPHPAVKPVGDSELILRPGDQIAIETEIAVDLGVDSTGAPISAADQLKQALQGAGFSVVESSNKRLIGRSMPGETKEISYSVFGAFGQEQKTSYTQRVFELELLVDGEVVWRRRRVQEAPHHLRLEENESVDQAVQRLMRMDVGFFRSTIPSRILPTAAEQARTSTLSVDGLQ
ncbi:MAG TPA: SHD1 domain-containing protein [Lacipirellulaceae bacterium]|nr:SHD1 domain-containing protein [Lacipirellulaceae bacterium]